MSKQRLVDIDKILEGINNIGFYTGKMSDGDYCEEIMNIIQNAPIVEERKYGRWEYSHSPDGDLPYCSECLSVPKTGLISELCLNCGAIMNEEDSNEKI